MVARICPATFLFLAFSRIDSLQLTGDSVDADGQAQWKHKVQMAITSDGEVDGQASQIKHSSDALDNSNEDFDDFARQNPTAMRSHSFGYAPVKESKTGTNEECEEEGTQGGTYPEPTRVTACFESHAPERPEPVCPCEAQACKNFQCCYRKHKASLGKDARAACDSAEANGASAPARDIECCKEAMNGCMQYEPGCATKIWATHFGGDPVGEDSTRQLAIMLREETNSSRMEARRLLNARHGANVKDLDTTITQKKCQR